MQKANRRSLSNQFISSAAWLFLLATLPRIAAAYIPELQYIVPIVYLFMAVAVCLHPERAALGFKKPQYSHTTALLVALLVGYYFLSSFVLWQMFGATLDNWNTKFWLMMKDVGGVEINVWFFLTTSAVLIFYTVEEFYFRGILFSQLRKKNTAAITILIISALWAILHLGVYGMNPFNGNMILGMLPSVFGMGVFLGLLREVTGSAFMCAIAQAIGNIALLGWTASYMG